MNKTVNKLVNTVTLEQAAEPLIKWLNENVNPHHQVIVTPDGALLTEDVARIKNDKHIKD